MKRAAQVSTGTVLKSTVVVALGGLLFGFDTVVISGTPASPTHHFQLNEFSLGVALSSAPSAPSSEP